jgi:DNA-binding Lrp family transcriptional regulator
MPLSTIRLYREKWIRDKIVIDQKTLARLRYQEGLTIRELSERCGLSLSSMKVRLYNLDRTGNKKKEL